MADYRSPTDMHDCRLFPRPLRRTAAGLLIGCMFACQATAQPAPALGAHTLLQQEDGSGVSPAVTPAITTQANGSSLLVFDAGYTSNSIAPTDNRNNVLTLLGSPVFYEGYNGTFDVKAYLALNARGGTGHQVSVIKNAVPQGEITIPFVEIRDADTLAAVAQTYAQTGSNYSSGNVTTTGPAVLVALWWGDGTQLNNTAVPDNGFTIIENAGQLPPNSGVQCVVAARTVTAAGTYHVTWSVSPAQGAPLWLLAFQNGSSGDVIFANGFD